MTLAGLPRVTLVSSIADLRAAWADAATRRAVSAGSVAQVSELEHLAGQFDVVVLDVTAERSPEAALVELRSIPAMRSTPCVLAVGPALLGAARAAADRCPSGCAVTMKPLSFARALAAAVDVMAESEGVRRSSSRPAPSSTLRVLVADDDRINRMATRLLLKKSGLVIEEAADGRSALDAYRAGHHDVLILDLHMPDMLGTAVAREVRRQPLPPGAPAPFIIALTAGAFAADREACLSAGMDAFLTKPLDPAALHAALETAERRTRRERRMATPMLELAEGDFDWTRLDTLWSLCDSDAERYELVSAYLRQSEELTATLRSSTSAGAWGTAADAAHKVAGATSTVGALGVERAARSFERLVRASEAPDHRSPAQDEISRALEDLLGALMSAERALNAKAMRVRARSS